MEKIKVFLSDPQVLFREGIHFTLSGEEDFEVSTPESSLSSLKGILGGVQMFIIIVASISIFIGALGIVNTMTTSVLERRKEIRSYQ